MNELKDTSHQPRLPASEEQGLEMPHTAGNAQNSGRALRKR